MKQNRLIFFAIFGAFHLFLVIFSFYVESNKNDFAFLSQLLKWVTIMKWGAMFGLLLLLADVIWSLMISRETNKEKAALTHEINTLKAKMFDLQEAASNAPATRPSNPNVK